MSHFCSKGLEALLCQTGCSMGSWEFVCLLFGKSQSWWKCSSVSEKWLRTGEQTTELKKKSKNLKHFLSLNPPDVNSWKTLRLRLHLSVCNIFRSTNLLINSNHKYKGTNFLVTWSLIVKRINKSFNWINLYHSLSEKSTHLVFLLVLAHLLAHSTAESLKHISENCIQVTKTDRLNRQEEHNATELMWIR